MKDEAVYSRSPEVHQALWSFLRENGITPYPQKIKQDEAGKLDRELLRVMQAIRKAPGLSSEQRREFIDYLKESRADLKAALSRLRSAGE
jgi:hypothetical protein